MHDAHLPLSSDGRRPRGRLVPLALAAALSLGLACAGKTAPPPHAAAPAQAARTAAGAPLLSPDEMPLPLDPQVRAIELPNGLTIFLRRHGKPEKRAALRLAVNVGSVLETEAERGLAHYVEHMAFNGTRLFKKQEIVDFMERVGMRFGQHANAYTGFDETVYSYEVPTDDQAILEKALLMLQQVAAEVSFDAEEVERERGVVISEWRGGRGAHMRVTETILPVLFKGSRYAERLAIGKKEVLETASAEDLRRFYKKWYRPDLMAIAVVGDFDLAAVEAKLRALFGQLPRPTEALDRPAYPVVEHATTLVAVAQDKELPSTTVGVLQKLPRRPQRSALDYRRHAAEGLFHSMLNARFEELSKTEDPPFLGARSSTGGFVRTSDVFMQMAEVKQDQTARGLEALTREIERVERHGFTASELERAKGDRLRRMEARVKEEEKLFSALYAGELVGHFLNARALPGAQAELDLLRRFLPGISLAEVNRLTKEWIAEKNRVILVQGPASAVVPPEAELLSVFQRVQKEEIAAYVDAVTDAPLVGALPAPGRIERERTIEEIGVTEWKLSNGATVFFKSTDFKNDEILLQASSPGGLSLVSDRDHLTGRFASRIVGSSGWGSVGPDELRKKLSGKIVSVRPIIRALEEAIEGHASPDDLETMLQLVHLAFTAPRRDPKVFAAWQARLGEELARARLSPEQVFSERHSELFWNNHLRQRPLDPGDEKKIDLDKALALYKERYADASGFTFGFVGRIDPATFKPLVLKYVATLPSSAKGARERWRDVGVRAFSGKKSFEVKKGMEPKSRLSLALVGRGTWTREEDHLFKSLLEGIDIKLREVIREELGATYGVSVNGSFARRPIEWHRIEISLTCDPTKLETVRTAIEVELAKARKEGLDAAYVEKVKAAQRRALEQRQKTNAHWLSGVLSHYTHRTDPRLLLEEGRLIEALSAPRLKKAAARYLAPRNVLVGVLRPDAAPKAASATEAEPPPRATERPTPPQAAPVAAPVGG